MTEVQIVGVVLRCSGPWSLTVQASVNGLDMAHIVCWGTLPFSGATTKGSLSPRVPQALYNKDPSAVQTLLFTAILRQATVSIMHLFKWCGCSPLLCSISVWFVAETWNLLIMAFLSPSYLQWHCITVDRQFVNIQNGIFLNRSVNFRTKFSSLDWYSYVSTCRHFKCAAASKRLPRFSGKSCWNGKKLNFMCETWVKANTVEQMRGPQSGCNICHFPPTYCNLLLKLKSGHTPFGSQDSRL